MIYTYGFYKDIFLHLLANLPKDSIQKIGQLTKLNKVINEGDLVLFFNWGEGARRFQQRMIDAYGDNIVTFPNFTRSLMLDDRIWMCQAIGAVTDYPLKRVYIKGNTVDLKDYSVPNIADKVVVKIGNEHQGEGKYLKVPGDLVRTKQSVVFEEFVPNARSIRIMTLDGTKDTLFIVEHVNSKFAKLNSETSWIKNIDPVETVYSYEERYNLGIKEIDNMIREVLKYYVGSFNTPYIGVDFVVGEEKIGLLEVNDMIGLPDDERVKERAKAIFLSLAEDYLRYTKGLTIPNDSILASCLS